MTATAWLRSSGLNFPSPTRRRRYATYWDAFDKDVIDTHIPPLIIMIVLCVWAILVIILFGCVSKYVESSWIKPLADEEVQSLMYDMETGAEFSAKPEPAVQQPMEPLAGPVNVVSVVADAEQEMKPEPQPQPQSEPVVIQAEAEDAIAPLVEEVKVDPDFKLQPAVEQEDLADIIVSWKPPAGVRANEIEYKMEVTDMDSENHEKEVFILPGSRTKYMIDQLAGEPIIPDEQFLIALAYVSKRRVALTPNAIYSLLRPPPTDGATSATKTVRMAAGKATPSPPPCQRCP